MKIKKFMSMFVAAVVVTSALVAVGTVNVSAIFDYKNNKDANGSYDINYVVGSHGIWDFEDGTNAFIADSGNALYGKALKKNADNADNKDKPACDFSQWQQEDTYVLSFDVYTSSTNVMMNVFTKYKGSDGSQNNLEFMQFKGGKIYIMKHMDEGNRYEDSGVTFNGEEWHHYDVKANLGQTSGNEATLYIDGMERYQFSLRDLRDSSKVGSPACNLAIGKLQFVWVKNDDTAGQYAYIDNIYVRKFSARVTMTGTQTAKGFEIDFSETMPKLQKDNLTVTRTLVGGTNSEAIDFELTQPMPTRAVIELQSFDRGYTYTISLADGITTALGNTVSESFTCKYANAVELKKSWDFETGAAWNNTEIKEEQNRGKVLYFKDTAGSDFVLDATLEGGVYIYSYDVKLDALTANDGDGNWRIFTTFDDKEFAGFKFDKGETPQLGSCYYDGNNNKFGDKFSSTDWYRIDHIIDLDEGLVDIYRNGQKLGSINLNNLGIKSMSKFNIKERGANKTYLDNVDFITAHDTYGAKISAVGKELIIDFDETTYLEDDDITVTKQTGLFDTQNMTGTIKYNSGKRAIIEFSDNLENALYTVAFNDVTSFRGTPIQPEISVNTNPDGAVRASFTDIAGNVSSGASGVPATANKMSIYYSNGMENGTFNGTVEVKYGESNVEYTGVWDNAAKTYTLTFNKLLGINKTYNVTVKDSKYSADGTYAAVTDSFTTKNSAPVFELSNFTYSVDSDGVDVSLNAVNTDTDKDAYIIYAGYNENGALTAVGHEKVTFGQCELPNMSHTFTDSNASSYSDVKVFLWESFETCKPMTNKAVKVQ